MGAAFLEKATKTFEKSWDQGRLELAKADLLTRLGAFSQRCFAARIRDGISAKKGDKCTVERVGNALVLSKGNTEIGRSDNPPPEFLRGREGVVFQGTVQEFYEEAGVADISL